MGSGDAPKVGKMVIGTAKGDIHDIGKNLVSMMMEGAGFEVVDLGLNNAVEKYMAAIEEHGPDILVMSALLTTTMPYIKVVIGADSYCREAAVAVETAKHYIAKRQGSAMAARA